MSIKRTELTKRICGGRPDAASASYDELSTMPCSDIITDDGMREFLHQLMINEDDMNAVSGLYSESSKSANGKIGKTDFITKMFLAYNERIGIDKFMLPVEEDERNAMLSPYASIRAKFVRDRIITLDFGHYSSIEAMNDQIAAVDAGLSDEEKHLLAEVFDGEQTVRNLVRMPESESKMAHAKAEKTEYLTKLSKILNNAYAVQVADQSLVCDENAALLESIFDKIDTGTIH